MSSDEVNVEISEEAAPISKSQTSITAEKSSKTAVEPREPSTRKFGSKLAAVAAAVRSAGRVPSKQSSSEMAVKKSSSKTESKQSLSVSEDRDLFSRSEMSFMSEEADKEEDEEIVEEEEDLTNFPYGRKYAPITPDDLRRVQLELNLVKLYWPQKMVPDVGERKHYPKSYTENNNKEKLLLWYTKNFQAQYRFMYKDRKPLFLAAENECALQKMVCTTIRPSIIRFPEFKTWEGCANFVADHLEFEPLEKPQLLPDHLYSPRAVLERQKGHIFEYSTLLCSFLIGSGYDAYVVSGYATREMCHFNQTRTDCPVLPDFFKKEEEVKDEAVPKYVIKAPPDLKSKFLLEMDERELRKKIEKQREKEETERLAIIEFEKPPPDEIFGTRVHSWVVVLPNSMGIEEVFFIDPLTGNKYELSYPNYLGIESIWNHTNYWVNLQDCKEGCTDIKFDLTDITCWEHLLAGEPWFSRKPPQRDEEEDSADNGLQEKHLDMPKSWVQKLDISNTDYERRFPGGSKTIYYKKCKLERFAPYVQEDGLVTRITTYADYDWQKPEWVYEYYSNRADCLTEIRMELAEESVVEIYKRGREDCLKEHRYYKTGTDVEDERTLEFYHMARLDGLERLEMHPVYLIQNFRDRQDFLYYRCVDYQQRGIAPMESPKRIVLKLVEEFNRNPEKEADQDIARRTFAVADNQILLKFHYAPGKVTAATREFIKPKLSEMGDRLTFNPDLTAGYQTDPTDKPPKKSYLFGLLEEQLKAEEDSLLSVRKTEDDVLSLLLLRMEENEKPQLDVSIYNMERNKLAIAGMKEVEKKVRAQVAMIEDEKLDFLAPYFAQIGNPEYVMLGDALKIRENCIVNFKRMLVDRINKIQEEFQEMGRKIEQKSKWFEKEQDNLTKLQEAAYIKENEELTFNLHVLEIRIARLRDLAPLRYQALEAYLRADPRLHILYY